MRSARLCLMAVVGVVMLMGAIPAQAAIKIGVVDIVEVTAQYKRLLVANIDLNNDAKGLDEKNKSEIAKVKGYQDARDAFGAGTDNWKKANEEFMKNFVQYQGWLALERAKVEVKHRDVLLEIYNQIVAAVTQAASDQKCDIVFTKAFLSPPQIDVATAQGLEDLKSRILNQRILYPPPAAMTDLTKTVYDALNATYTIPPGYDVAPTSTAAPTGTVVPTKAPAPTGTR
jgi:Skp family chaperone for outer membrane proteins